MRHAFESLDTTIVQEYIILINKTVNCILCPDNSPRDSKHAYESIVPILSLKNTYIYELNADSKLTFESIIAVIMPNQNKQATSSQILIPVNPYLCLEKGPYQAIGGGKTNSKKPGEVSNSGVK